VKEEMPRQKKTQTSDEKKCSADPEAKKTIEKTTRKRKRHLGQRSPNDDDEQKVQEDVPPPANVEEVTYIDQYNNLSLEGWLLYDKKRFKGEDAVNLLERRLRDKHPHEIRLLLKANSQLQTGTAQNKRIRIAEGIVIGFSFPCKTYESCIRGGRCSCWVSMWWQLRSWGWAGNFLQGSVQE
jgi:hypothetical protein